MSSERRVTYLNLIDRVILLEKGGKVKGDEVFRKLLMEYFFKNECDEKKVAGVVKSLELPAFFSQSSLLELDMDQFSAFVKGSVAVDSLAGKIILSKQYLQIFHRDHVPEISKMPSDIQLSLITDVKNKNEQIITAFDKMRQDLDADRRRTVTSLIALILRNIRMRTGMRYAEIDKPADDIIGGIFRTAGDVFSAAPEQCSELSDDKHIKLLIKEFCVIRKNSELSEMADNFRKEYERYLARAKFAFAAK